MPNEIPPTNRPAALTRQRKLYGVLAGFPSIFASSRRSLASEVKAAGSGAATLTFGAWSFSQSACGGTQRQEARSKLRSCPQHHHQLFFIFSCCVFVCPTPRLAACFAPPLSPIWAHGMLAFAGPAPFALVTLFCLFSLSHPAKAATTLASTTAGAVPKTTQSYILLQLHTPPRSEIITGFVRLPSSTRGLPVPSTRAPTSATKQNPGVSKPYTPPGRGHPLKHVRRGRPRARAIGRQAGRHEGCHTTHRTRTKPTDQQQQQQQWGTFRHTRPSRKPVQLSQSGRHLPGPLTGLNDRQVYPFTNSEQRD